MKSIKLKCQTGGFKYDDIVDLTKKDCKITVEVAEGLVKDGFAEVVEVAEVVKKSKGK